MNKTLLFSVTASDCDWSYARGRGAGGQARNRSNNAVHCTHRPSGAHGYSEASRSQHHNKCDAFIKMASSDEFTKWNKLEALRRMGVLDEIDRKIEHELLHNVKIEVKIDGSWYQVSESMLVDDPDNFRVDLVIGRE